MSQNNASRFPAGSRGLLAATALTAGLGAAGLTLNKMQAPTVDAFDPSRVDICSPNTLCDNTQVKLMMQDPNGHVSANSIMGKTLTGLVEKHAPGKISDASVVDMMSRFEGTLTHAMPTPTAVGTSGMMLMKGPQKAGLKSQYGLYAFVQDGEGCGAYEIKMDGTAVPAKLAVGVSGHSAPVPGCTREAAALSKQMTQDFSV